MTLVFKPLLPNDYIPSILNRPPKKIPTLVGCYRISLLHIKADLETIRPMLDEMFDFEKTFAERTQVNAERFMNSGSYLYLRSGLIKRWNVLAEFYTYPNMIRPLSINLPR